MPTSRNYWWTASYRSEVSSKIKYSVYILVILPLLLLWHLSFSFIVTGLLVECCHHTFCISVITVIYIVLEELVFNSFLSHDITHMWCIRCRTAAFLYSTTWRQLLWMSALTVRYLLVRSKQGRQSFENSVCNFDISGIILMQHHCAAMSRAV